MQILRDNRTSEFLAPLPAGSSSQRGVAQAARAAYAGHLRSMKTQEERLLDQPWFRLPQSAERGRRMRAPAVSPGDRLVHPKAVAPAHAAGLRERPCTCYWYPSELGCVPLVGITGKAAAGKLRRQGLRAQDGGPAPCHLSACLPAGVAGHRGFRPAAGTLLRSPEVPLRPVPPHQVGHRAGGGLPRQLCPGPARHLVLRLPGASVAPIEHCRRLETRPSHSLTQHRRSAGIRPATALSLWSRSSDSVCWRSILCFVNSAQCQLIKDDSPRSALRRCFLAAASRRYLPLICKCC